MAEHGFFSHTGSDGSKVSERLSRSGYDWMAVGENLAYGSVGHFTAETVVRGWLESPPHCTVIMTPDFTEMGIVKLTDGYDFWVQVFARPRG
jgi:uncharacterized protein YkwD